MQKLFVLRKADQEQVLWFVLDTSQFLHIVVHKTLSLSQILGFRNRNLEDPLTASRTDPHLSSSPTPSTQSLLSAPTLFGEAKLKMHGVKRQPKSATSSEARAARKAKESAKLTAYLEIERTFFTYKTQSRKDTTALEHTTKLLTLNPELYTVWNYRREILLALFASPVEEEKKEKDVFASLREATPAIEEVKEEEEKEGEEGEEKRKERNRNMLEDDLSLTEHALRAHPKVYWIWNHRMWCLTQYPAPAGDGGESWVWERELKLVEKMLDYDPRNFHGWNCRRAIVQHLAISILSADSGASQLASSSPSFPALLSDSLIVQDQAGEGVKAKLLTLADRELGYALRKIESNFSNFSAWHQRTQLLPHVWIARKLGVKQVDAKVDEELELVKQAMYTDPADQSVWFYHRWLIDRLLSSSGQEEEGEERKERKLKVIKEEIEVIEELFELEPESKWCAISLAHLYMISDGLDGEEKGKGKAKELLDKLIELDPDREARYRDLLEGKAHF